MKSFSDLPGVERIEMSVGVNDINLRLPQTLVRCVASIDEGDHTKYQIVLSKLTKEQALALANLLNITFASGRKA